MNSLDRINLGEAAQVTGVTASRLHRAIRGGGLRHVRIGRYRRIYTTAEWVSSWQAAKH